MNKKSKISIIMLSSICGLSAEQSVAQDNDNPLSVSINAGVEFDSNLTVDSIDSTSNVGDTAFVFDGSIGYDIVDSNEVGFSVGYDFYQNLHQDLDAFDMQIHGFNMDARRSFDRIDLGVAYLFNNVKLGGDKFLDIHTLRPNVGYLMPSNKVYLMGAFEFQEQKFKLNNLLGRNAKRYSLSTKAIFLMGEGRTITAGYAYSDHNSRDNGYSYKGHTFDVSLKIPLEMMERETTFRAGYRLAARGYNMASLSYDTVIRSDTRHTANVSWEVPIVSGVSAKVEYEYIASNSTYAPIDYNESITTISVGWKF